MIGDIVVESLSWSILNKASLKNEKKNPEILVGTLKVTRKDLKLKLFLTSYLLKEQFLFCSSLEHWDRADIISSLGCAGAGGVAVMLTRQSQ